MRRIDCHMHFWTLAMEPHYSLWMKPEEQALYRDFGPRDALPLMAQKNVEGVVLVSAANSVHETGYLLGLADSNDFIKGVVSWIDMLAPSVAGDLAGWARFSKLKGIRPYLQDLPEDDWILNKALDPAIRALLDLGLRFDALIKPRHVINTVKFIERYPDLPVIIDHLAKPDIKASGYEPWRRDMENFRDLKHVHCKVSGVLTEDGPNWTLDRLRPYLEAVFDIFGSDRLIFGSDWPVINIVADYSTWIETLQSAMHNYTFVQRQNIWANNGERFYGLLK
jgi:L-fuconolactonase